jgi:hypothetical protein
VTVFFELIQRPVANFFVVVYHCVHERSTYCRITNPCGGQLSILGFYILSNRNGAMLSGILRNAHFSTCDYTRRLGFFLLIQTRAVFHYHSRIFAGGRPPLRFLRYYRTQNESDTQCKQVRNDITFLLLSFFAAKPTRFCRYSTIEVSGIV